jgi:hypothetical protein
MSTVRAALLAAAVVLAAGAAHADNGEIAMTRDVAVAGAPVSRAEVLADLHLWQRAGLGETGEADTLSAGYQAKLAAYQRLRSGPAFAAEVERLQRPSSQRGTASLAPARDVH